MSQLPRALIGALVGLILLASTAASGKEHTFGIGIALGEPTAIDFKWRATRLIGLNVGVGAHHFSRNLAIYADLEFAPVHFKVGGGTDGVFYIGPGLQLGIADGDHYYGWRKESGGGTYIGLMMPIGVEFSFSFPLEIFVELRPGIVLVESPGAFDLGGQVGFRYGW
jgi:hypothetical protein